MLRVLAFEMSIDCFIFDFLKTNKHGHGYQGLQFVKTTKHGLQVVTFTND